MSAELEQMAATLEASGEYRILRRLRPRAPIAAPEGVEVRLCLALDVETTGLNPATDEIIELAIVPFTYSPDGQVLELREPFHRYRQPGKPIPPEITALTGITDDMVRGQTIDPAEVAAFIAPAVLVIAHHASFDRPFVQRFCPQFASKHWACSMSEIDWSGEGAEGTKLGYLVQSLGLFFEKHRAIEDCKALVELLARPLPRSGTTGLARLLEAARQPTFRIWAKNSPFQAKDLLKARGYRWSSGDNGQPKSWFIDATEATRDAEIAFLHERIYQRRESLHIERMTARERFAAGA